MGICSSRVLSHPERLSQELKGTLETGDILFMLDGSKTSKYLFKAAPLGGWVSARCVGFVVQESPGPEGLAFYHTDDTQVRRCSLIDELDSGRYRVAVVRKLHKRLTPEQIQLVHTFVQLNAGKPIEPPSLDSCAPTTTNILMANTSGARSTAYERLCCSEFVCLMLHLVGMVEPTDNPSEFAATHRKGRLVGPPIVIKLLPKNTRSNSSIGHSASSVRWSTTSSSSPRTTTRSSSLVDDTHTCAVVDKLNQAGMLPKMITVTSTVA